jgi:hypothetical protein
MRIAGRRLLHGNAARRAEVRYAPGAPQKQFNRLKTKPKVCPVSVLGRRSSSTLFRLRGNTDRA